MAQFPTTDDTSSPEELTEGGKNTWRTEMGVPSGAELDDVEVKADNAVSTANAAQATANAACPDNQAIKTTGDQSKGGVLSFTSAKH